MIGKGVFNVKDCFLTIRRSTGKYACLDNLQKEVLLIGEIGDTFRSDSQSRNLSE